MSAVLGTAAVLVVALAAWSGSAAFSPNPARDAARAARAAPTTRAPGTPRQTMGPHGDEVPPPWEAANRKPTDPANLTGYRWPITHARITNAFGLGRPGSFVMNGEPVHEGLDVSNFCGARITAAHDGVVLAAGRHFEAFMGWVGDLAPFRERTTASNEWRRQSIVVAIDDGNGYRSLYVHLAKTAVKAGEFVHAGDLIGYEGQTGNATGCHLHYALFSPLERRTMQLDPAIGARLKLPALALVRIDPLSVLPPLEDGDITWNWGAGGP
ncbi:MAG: M23 family metallopeptidase [Candidatus Limnocylindrales bacterium]